MSTAAQPQLEPGRAYRTRDLRRWSANPTRLARRLVDEGKLREASHGLYYAPIPTRFGPAPPPSEELLRAFLGGEPFLVTGPPYWNALGLGSTAMFAVTLVYNTRGSGEFRIGGRRETGIRMDDREECGRACVGVGVAMTIDLRGRQLMAWPLSKLMRSDDASRGKRCRR